MKPQKTYFIILLLFFIWSCNTNKKESKEILQETVKAVKKAPKSNDFRERLKTTEPATEAQLKNWLPENLGNFKRETFTTSRISQNSIASAGAIYKNDENQKLEITIVDGASKDGLLAINTHYMAQNMKINSNKASGYEKTYERNGLKVLETYAKKDNFYRVLFLYDMRFGITLKSYNLSNDELWSLIDKLDKSELNNL
ncbi:hypothetical protein C8N26_2687 [Tenacibaculum lutimaris]|uniref:Uncharacterized protein n=1 Tax=Tenacibaculum lutimaris TaxID=285258 RepID=A0A420DYI8_9FLAO|nr:hypothetical protein [Tenacibaculum lutimaris]RKF02837.1 hypothetical protein C8N26_2687 [Tenacibaculum lutimaris]